MPITASTEPIRIEHVFAAAAAAYPERQALIYGGHSWTYAALMCEVRQRACALRAAGLQGGATVISTEPLTDDLLFASLACCHLNLIFCHLSPRYTASEIVPLASRAAAHLVLTGDGAPHPMLPALPALPLRLPGNDGGVDARCPPSIPAKLRHSWRRHQGRRHSCRSWR